MEDSGLQFQSQWTSTIDHYFECIMAVIARLKHQKQENKDILKDYDDETLKELLSILSEDNMEKAQE